MTRPLSGDADLRRARHLFRRRAEAAEVAKLEAEADVLGEAVVTEQANRWLRNASAVTAWMGTTVIEVVSVVLVIVNYLFPGERPRYA